MFGMNNLQFSMRKFMDIENRTFWINNAEREDYEIKDNQVILWEPDVFARCEY